jgi:hypothetical protein
MDGARMQRVRGLDVTVTEAGMARHLLTVSQAATRSTGDRVTSPHTYYTY